MRWRSGELAISPYPAKTIADLQLDENVYKPDFQITDKFQAFSKELARISLLGLGAYGFLIKLAADKPGSEFLLALQKNRWLALCGVASFALSAACALLHGFMSTQCLGHQLVISRYFGRLEGNRWDDRHKEDFRAEIKRQQKEQRAILIKGNHCLLVATVALIAGAVLVATCTCLVLFNK